MNTKNVNICLAILLLLIILSAALFLFLAHSENEMVVLPVVADYELPAIVERKDLKVGVVPGPYGDMFMEAIMPSLEKMGYTATLVHFDDFVSPNFALAQGEIDLNIFQHYTYLNNFKFENDLALSAITEIPTISMGVYTNNLKYRSVDDLDIGVTVSIPADSSNLARALMVLEAAGIINLNPFIDRSKATIADIISNPLDIQFVPIEAHNLVNSLRTYDLSVINGNFALSGGLRPSEALYNEMLAKDYINVIAVRTEDLNKQFVRDIIYVIHTHNFRDIIVNPTGKYADFQRPRSFYDRPFAGWRGRP